MVLLIQDMEKLRERARETLHSNMVLLIRSSMSAMIFLTSFFTFQYGSINTDMTKHVARVASLHSNMVLLILNANAVYTDGCSTLHSNMVLLIRQSNDDTDSEYSFTFQYGSINTQ